MECLVCTEIFDEKNLIDCSCRKIICCKKCTVKYILQSNKNAHCMACRSEWDERFLHQNFTKKWLNSNKSGGYRNHLKKIILDEETPKLQLTISRIEQTKKRVSCEENIQRMRKRKIQNTLEISNVKREYQRKRSRVEDRSHYQSAMQSLEKESDDIQKSIDSYKLELEKLKTIHDDGIHFMLNCPQKKCIGFIESDTLMCKVCKIKVCRECREPRVENNHRCDKNIIENIKNIQKETKRCPKCNCMIYKSGGCNDMWCTVCRIYFDWNTGNRIIRKGYIENPHATEWLDRIMHLTRNFDDIPCGGIDNIAFEKIKNEDVVYMILRIYNLVKSIGGHLMKNTNIDDPEEIREKYVLGKMTEEEWITKVYKFRRKEERKRKNVSILETLRILIVERIRNLKLELEEVNYDEECKFSLKFILDIDLIIKFINETFETELELLGSRNPLKIINYIILK